MEKLEVDVTNLRSPQQSLRPSESFDYITPLLPSKFYLNQLPIHS